MLRRLSILVLFSFSCAHADYCSEHKLSKEQANSALLSIQSFYEGIKSFKADFSQSSYLDAMGITENSNGKVLFKKQGNMLWHYTAPDEQIFTVKDGSVWLYQVQDKQVLVDNIEKMLLSDLPVSFLMGLGSLVKDFTIVEGCKLDAEKISLSLKPSKAEGELSTFVINVDRQFFPIQVVISDASANRNIISLNNYDLNASIEDQEFITEYPNDVDVNDVRGKK